MWLKCRLNVLFCCQFILLLILEIFTNYCLWKRGSVLYLIVMGMNVWLLCIWIPCTYWFNKMCFIHHHKKIFSFVPYPSILSRFLPHYFPLPILKIISSYVEPLPSIHLLNHDVGEYVQHNQFWIDHYSIHPHEYSSHRVDFTLRLGGSPLYVILPIQFYFYCSHGIRCSIALSTQLKRNCAYLVNLYNEIMQLPIRLHWKLLFMYTTEFTADFYLHSPFWECPREFINETKVFQSNVMCTVQYSDWDYSSPNEPMRAHFQFHSFL